MMYLPAWEGRRSIAQTNEVIILGGGGLETIAEDDGGGQGVWKHPEF